MENEFEIKDFNKNPLLRKLLVDYCLSMYEEHAIIDDEHLLKEYNWLKLQNSLVELFSCEYLLNDIELSVTAHLYGG